MKDVDLRRELVEQVYWSCRATRCIVQHGSSSIAARCPTRLQQLVYERECAGQTDEGLLSRLIEAQVGGCNCHAGPALNILHHDGLCHYRLHAETHEELLKKC